MVLFLLSCMTNYIKVDPAYDLKEKTPVLLTGAALRADSFFPSSAENNYAQDMILFHMQQFVNQKLPLVGENMVDQILPHLIGWGAVPYTEPERAHLLNYRQSKAYSVNTQLMGIWVDPNASTKFITGNDLFLFRKTQKIVALLQDSSLKSENGTNREGYLFIHAAYYSSSFFLVRYPIVVLDVLVIGNDGQIWLKARTTGEGERQMFNLDISEENLRSALQNAVDALGILEPFTIKRRGKFKKRP